MFLSSQTANGCVVRWVVFSLVPRPSSEKGREGLGGSVTSTHSGGIHGMQL